MWCLFVFSCLLQMCVGSRVLAVFPVPSRSHAALGDSIVTTLLLAGHEVSPHDRTASFIQLIDNEDYMVLFLNICRLFVNAT